MFDFSRLIKKTREVSQLEKDKCSQKEGHFHDITSMYSYSSTVTLFSRSSTISPLQDKDDSCCPPLVYPYYIAMNFVLQGLMSLQRSVLNNSWATRETTREGIEICNWCFPFVLRTLVMKTVLKETKCCWQNSFSWETLERLQLFSVNTVYLRRRVLWITKKALWTIYGWPSITDGVFY